MIVETFAEFLATSIFAFMLVFMRFGTALMVMPGIGDTYVSERIRLHLAVALTLTLFPVLMPFMPDKIPGTFMLFTLVAIEFLIGLFIGIVARIFMAALDVAGMVISIQSGFANAQVFNPALASQGSVFGAFLSVTGVLLLFVTDLHHLMILGVYESYNLFPVGQVPDTGSMADFIAKAVSLSFIAGVQFATPFIVMTLLLYTGMGVLSRLMPQVQVFLLALPLQILMALVLLSLILSAGMMFWLSYFQDGMVFFLSQGG